MPRPSSLDFQTLRRGYEAGDFSPRDVAEEVLERIGKRGDDAVWIHRLSREEILGHADRIQIWKRDGKSLPLYGIPFSIKDNIDLADQPTTAACPAFSYRPKVSATAVQKLIDAGALPVGKTNLDQFATGLVGVRSPYGAPRCVFNSRYISGGSSSGSAVAVAADLVGFSLGTDTAGSGRVPAAFNNLVGLKPTRGRVSIKGVVPACRSLDCVSVFARTTAEAGEVLRVMEGIDPDDAWSRAVPPGTAAALPAAFRFGVPRPEQLKFFGDHDASGLYDRAVARLQKMGGQKVIFDFGPFLKTARLLYHGPWVAERMAAIRDFYAQNAEAMDPTVRKIISGAEKMTAVDAFEGIYQLQELRRQAAAVWNDVDLLALPTTGTIYTVEEIQADPIGRNTDLGYYTNFMNLLDLAGLALPAGFRPNGLPFGLTLAAPAFTDEMLCGLGRRWEEQGADL
jgi:allophanate hydrolase